MESPDPGRSERRAMRRVPAVTRSAGAERYVCAVGWGTPVHRLQGAAAAVWAALESCDQLGDLASLLAVEPRDPYLLRAIDLLADVGLVELDERR